MSKLIVVCILITTFGACLADPHHRPGKFLKHDRTVVNCAKYKREANQHQCVLSPFNTEGPFYLPDDHERSDLTDGQVGVQLDLTLNFVNSNDCTPLENMYVHIWHTNALGKYSGVSDLGPPPPPPANGQNQGGERGPGGPGGPGGRRGRPGDERGPAPPRNGTHSRRPGGQRPDGGMNGGGGGGRPTPVSDERWLRGYQVTDSNGQVNFKTIIPGWYQSRCIHIHIEVYPKNSTEQADISYVGQIFFKNEMPNELKLIDPYSTNTQRITYNDDDGIYLNHGNETILNLISQGNGYSSTLTFGIDPDSKVHPN